MSHPSTQTDGKLKVKIIKGWFSWTIIENGISRKIAKADSMKIVNRHRLTDRGGYYEVTLLPIYTVK